MRHYPSHRNLRHRNPKIGRNFANSRNHFAGPTLHIRIDSSLAFRTPKRAVVRHLSSLIRTAKKPNTQRTVCHDPNTSFTNHRKQFVLLSSIHQRVRILHSNQRLSIDSLLHFQRLHNLPRLEITHSHITYLALLNQRFHCSELLFEQAHIVNAVE